MAERREEDRPEPTTVSPSGTRLLFGYLRPHWRMLVFGGVLSVASSGAGLAMPLMARYVVEAFGDGRSLAGPVLLLCAVVVAGAVISAVGRYLMGRTGEVVILGARRRLVRRMLRLTVGAADRFTPGDLLARVTSDTTLLRTVLTTSTVEAAGGLAMLVGAITLMIVLDAVLLGVTLLVVLIIGCLMALLMPRIQRAQIQAQRAVGDMGALLDRALQAFRTVKVNGAEEREAAVVGDAAERACRQGVTVAGWTALSGVAVLMSVQLAFLSVLAVGGARVAAGTLEISDLVAFLLYLFYLVVPLTQLVEGWADLHSGLAAVRRIREVEELPGEPTARHPSTPGTAPLGVEFNDVTFRYGADRSVAHDGVTFMAPPGGLTALVGPSGAGKSTVFALLARFYDHQDGSIAVGGRDIRDWPLGELRAALGYVEQDAPVLAGTLKENLLFAAPEASTAELRRAVARTQLDDLITRLPEGWDTPVGHRGVLLSGGERQRIAIARALLRKPRLLLLDEVTSQLDAVNEQRLREVIGELATETTILAIAHRLSTVTHADRIVVMEAGRVRTVGRHADLRDSDALYRELAVTQLTPSP